MDFSNQPPWIADSDFEPNIFPPCERPTAQQLGVGLAKAAEEGRIAAWHGKLQGHDYTPMEQSDGSWLTCCPAHDDHNPSLVVTDGSDDNGNAKLLVYCRSGCAQETLLSVLDELGLWNVNSETIEELNEEIAKSSQQPAKKRAKMKCEAIVPVPHSAPPPPNNHFQLGPLTKRWDYRNVSGELVFSVCRFDPNPTWRANYANDLKGEIAKPDHKEIRPQSYCRFEDGTTRWSWRLPKGDVPLYGADKLAANPLANVIVCEGEKAADAAQLLFPDCAAVTWWGGAKAVHKTSWQALAKRDVLVWPDFDAAGTAAAEAILKELRKVGCGCVSEVMVEALAAIDPNAPDGALRTPPAKWDAADAIKEWSNLSLLKERIRRFTLKRDERVRIQASDDDIGATVDKVEAVLFNSSLPVFKRAGYIVRVGHCQEKLVSGANQQVLLAQTLNNSSLGEVLERVIRFEQYDTRKRGNKSIHAPKLLVDTFLGRGKLTGLKPLTGLTDVPLVRRDGTLLATAGYDEATGIYYMPAGVIADVPEQPTADDARRAVETLRHLIRDFPFQSEVDEAAAISAFVSGVNRPTLGAMPLHAISAPTPGSGKSLLAELVTIIATGHMPAFITQGPNDEELEKRVATQMLEGRQVINLDNCNRPIKGAALCNLLTAERVSLRILGKSEAPEITSSSFILANGNNMRLADDMVRRTVICYIDPKMERPEERAFGWDAKEEAFKNRSKYVAACLTIMLAYKAVGAPKQTTPLGSFEHWGRFVRDAIIWAGLPDPCGNAVKLREADPELERFVAVAEQWSRHFEDQWVKLADVIAAADASGQDGELKLALMSVADSGPKISSNRLAAFLARYKDRPLAGFKFVTRTGRAGTNVWKLETVQ